MDKKYNKYLDYFPIPLDESKLIQLDRDGKNPLGKWDYHTADWIPFAHPTAIQCNWYEHLDMFLCCLDWDYKSKFNNPIWKDFEYTETLVRESKNGLHAFYLSKEPCKFKEKKTRNGGLDIDFKMARANNPYSNGGFVKYHSQYIDNGLEVLTIDINEVIASLYESNNVPLEEQGSYSNNAKPISTDEYVIDEYVEALAQYFYWKITTDNPDWKDGYSYSFELGLKLRAYLEFPKQANGFIIRLLELADQYDKPQQFKDNFINGWSAGNHTTDNNFGGKPLNKNEIFQKQLLNMTIEEYAKKLCKNTLHSYLLVIKNKIQHCEGIYFN